MLADQISSGSENMNKENPFEATACFTRIGRAMERLTEIFATLGEFGQVFENTPALKIESSEEMIIRVETMCDSLSQHLLARAFAEEGLAVIDQITSEVSIYKQDPQVPKTPALQQTVQTLENIKASADARKDELAAFRDSNEHIIETTMKSVQQMTGTMQNVAERLKKEMERRGK